MLINIYNNLSIIKLVLYYSILYKPIFKNFSFKIGEFQISKSLCMPL